MNVRRGAQVTTTASVFAISDTGVVRSNNEDRALVLHAAMLGEVLATNRATAVDLTSGPLLVAVSDGMGGANAGEVASALTIATLHERFAARPESQTDASFLRSAIERANETVRAAAEARPDHTGMGATLVATLLSRTHATVAVVGDSRAYVLRSGRLAPLTRDQTFLQTLLDLGVLTPAQAETFPHKNVVLHAIGNEDTPDPGILELPLRRGDRLLLCSDGLTNEIPERRIEKILSSNEDPRRACIDLVAAANAHGGADNVTVAVAFIDGDELPSPSREDVPPSPPSSGRFRTPST